MRSRTRLLHSCVIDTCPDVVPLRKTTSESAGSPGAPARHPRRRLGLSRSADHRAPRRPYDVRRPRAQRACGPVQRMLIKRTMPASSTKNARSIAAVRSEARST